MNQTLNTILIRIWRTFTVLVKSAFSAVALYGASYFIGALICIFSAFIGKMVSPECDIVAVANGVAAVLKSNIILTVLGYSCIIISLGFNIFFEKDCFHKYWSN